MLLPRLSSEPCERYRAMWGRTRDRHATAGSNDEPRTVHRQRGDGYQTRTRGERTRALPPSPASSANRTVIHQGLEWTSRQTLTGSRGTSQSRRRLIGEIDAKLDDQAKPGPPASLTASATESNGGLVGHARRDVLDLADERALDNGCVRSTVIMRPSSAGSIGQNFRAQGAISMRQTGSDSAGRGAGKEPGARPCVRPRRRSGRR